MLNQHTADYMNTRSESRREVEMFGQQFRSLLLPIWLHQKNTQLGAKKGPGIYAKRGERDCGNASESSSRDISYLKL